MSGAGVRLAALLMLAVAGTGCERRFMRTRGTVNSAGGPLGTWSLAPVSCSRDAMSETMPKRGVATLVWEDPSRRNKRYHDQGQLTAPVVPMRLDLMRDGGGVTGLLDVWRRKGVRLDQRVCAQLTLTTWQGAVAVPEGRPTLEGRLQMDCQVEGSHLTGDLEFKGCEY